MLRNIIIVSSAGVVLFSKEFIRAVAKPRLIGGLITAMLEFSVDRTGLPVSYIELSSVGVSISTNSTAKVSCALFYDVQDGPDFGHLIANEILQAFVQMFSVNDSRINPNEDFSPFNIKISEIIRNSIRPVLDELQQQRGIIMCLLTSGDSMTYSTQEVDKLGVLANVQALLGVATDIMSTRRDVPSQLTFKGDKTITVLTRIERTNFIVVCKSSIKPEVWNGHLKKATNLLRKVLSMASNLQDWHMT